MTQRRRKGKDIVIPLILTKCYLCFIVESIEEDVKSKEPISQTPKFEGAIIAMSGFFEEESISKEWDQRRQKDEERRKKK